MKNTYHRVSIAVAVSMLLCAMFAQPEIIAAQPAQSALELSRPVRTWEFLPIIGMNAGLFGNESGQMEAWVYPLKIFRNLHLVFYVDGRALPAESLVRTLIVHPESATLVYAGDNFSVHETLFVPVHEPGAVISFEIETEQPLEIEARFTGDFQLEWPAAVGGTYSFWDDTQHAFVFVEEQKKFAAMVGSPSGVSPSVAYQTNYSSSEENSLRLGVTDKGKDSKIIVVAGSIQGLPDAEAHYQRLASSFPELMRESAQYYRDYLNRTVNLTLPDAQLQQAYDWSRISTVQGLVTNATLGTGLVAGYRTSGTSQRPGFAWFFGRDSLWTSFALNSIGDFATTKTALEFISKFQRDDGKIPHEISQGASFVNWFKDYPYGFASADATPLYIIAANDYVTRSGDVDFARQKWDSLWKAYQFLRSTYDAQNFPQNFGFGHGWVEGGPLLPVKTEFYQSGLGLEALRALANLAKVIGKNDASKDLQAAFDRQKPIFNQTFWSPEKRVFAFALDQQNRRVDELSVLTTVPMWFGVTDEDKSQSTIQQLADADHQTDWGMRIISNRSPVYSGQGYGRLHESPFQCVARPRRIARPRRRSAFRRLLSTALHQFSASDLVGGDGREPDPARHDGARRRCADPHRDVCSPRPGRLEIVFAGQPARGRYRAGTQLPKNARDDHTRSKARRFRRLRPQLLSVTESPKRSRQRRTQRP